MRERQVKVLENLDAVSQFALDSLKGLLERSDQNVTIALSGGSTPKRLFEMMAQASLPLNRLELYWGDERYVPHDHKDSNYRMTRESLLAHAAVPASQVHPWPYLDTPQASADAYEQLLVSRFGGVNQVGFDVVLLGMGEDGHTASLFPGTAALSVRDRAAVANHVEKLDSWRLTMTYPVFENSRHVWFLACGAGKADIIPRVLAGEDFPSAHVRSGGELVWMLDEAAAAKLEART